MWGAKLRTIEALGPLNAAASTIPVRSLRPRTRVARNQVRAIVSAMAPRI
jgi:hypothetical protein